ncbi:MAG: hypothetical protein ACXVXE_10775 [Nocardioidaceae bacterium]
MAAAPRRRNPLAAGLASVLLAAVSGCGPSADHGGSAAGAASPSPSAPPASASSSPTASGPAGGLDRAGLVAAMKSSFAHSKSAHVAMRIAGSVQMSARGDVKYTPSGPVMKMTASMPQLGGKQMDLRFLGHRIYMSLPPMTPKGKFVKIDLNDPNDPMGKAMHGLYGSFDPQSQFATFAKGLKKVTYLGDGHYKLTVDTATITQRLRSTLGQQVPQMPKTVKYDLWLDSQQRMRKMRMSLLGQTTTMALSRWGEPVVVQAPPASAVVAAPGMYGRM